MKQLFLLIIITLTLNPVYAQRHKKVIPVRTEVFKESIDFNSPTAANISKKIHQLPWYGVFDWIEVGAVYPETHVPGKADSSIINIYLTGYVLRPITKIDAERVTREFTNVGTVYNNLEVLPLSMLDDQVRLDLYRSLFSLDSPTFRYGQGVDPAIHIIVRNGTLILKGSVLNKSDASIVYIKARQIVGVFEVRNELEITTERTH